jgi:tetratricopeptide (TPR) repeat protein
MSPALPARADEASGAYLAARQARYDNDFVTAAEQFSRALIKDPSNPFILEFAAAAYLATGELERALPIAQKIEAEGLVSQIANMILIYDEARRGAYDDLRARISDKRGIGELADGLISAWTELGKGDMQTALKQFDDIAAQRGLHDFAIYHKALALASVGDFEAADEIFSGASDGPLQRTRRGMFAWAQILSQLERNDEAVALIDDTFGLDIDPEIGDMRARLAAGEAISFTMINDTQDGIAEVFYAIGRALQPDTGEDYVLFYSRIAESLNPDHIEAQIMSAELLDALGRYDLATDAYRRVPQDHPAFQTAELGRSESLRKDGKTDAAIEVLEQLMQSHPDQAIVFVTAGDLYRQLEQFDDAVTAYDTAITLYAERDSEQWFVYYARAISHERLDNWDNAEADFRQALVINPNQPQALNYLGYSMVEKGINLDEALGMIKRAVKARPDSGYIIDSLGWVLYRMGRYDDAIGYMERAAELEAVDPVVNDHLGDVLWAVGRHTEAEFQWHRALSFVDEGESVQDVDSDRIRRKLEVGLDQVLSEEGADPLKVADDG